MKEFLKDLFSYKGRWNRLKLWLYPLVVTLPIMLLVLFAISLTSLQWYKLQAIEAKVSTLESQIATSQSIAPEGDYSSLSEELGEAKQLLLEESEGYSPDMNPILMILVSIFYIIAIYVGIVSYIKRFHDLGKSGWFTLFMFIPFVSIIFTIWIYFFKWTPGENQYGPDPLGWTAPAAVPVASKTTEEL